MQRAADRRRVTEMLSGRGLEVHESDSVDDALERLEREHVDLVLTDRLFEGHPDGHRLLASVLRQELGCCVAVIVEEADPAVVLDCLRTGAVDVLSRPVTEDAIDRLLRRTAELHAVHSAIDLPHTARVLLLEGDPIRRDRYGDILANHGYAVRIPQADENPAELAECEEVDLVILDGRYGGPGTLEHVREMKRRESCRHIPLMVTGPRDDVERMREAFRAGADDYLAEPVGTTDFVLQVRRLADWKTSHDRLREAKHESDRKREELARETWFFKELNRFLELDDKLEFIRKNLADLLGVARFAIARFDEDRLRLELLAHNLDRLDAPETLDLVDDDSAHEAIRGRTTVVLDPFDAGAHRRLPWLEGVTIRNLMTCPLVVGQRLWGVIHLVNGGDGETPVDYGETVVRILENLTNSLQNSMLYVETKRLAVSDGLTGLANHNAMVRHLQFEIDRVTRYDTKVSVVMFDLDNFKGINDRFGHPQGDTVLMEVAEILKSEARSTDFVARYGGEEFLAILADTPKQWAETFAHRIRERIERTDFTPVDGQSRIRCTVSIGVACAPDDAHTFDELLNCVDKRLYRAKRAGKNRVVTG
jgi:diguanylate cyclase (GGDEF)-like protein